MSVLRALQRFMRLTKGGSQDARGDLRALPMDVLLKITEYLPHASVFSLALTCHTMNYLILCRYPFCRFPGISAGNREDFLLLLEKDIGHLYYCEECVRLHPWRSRRRFNGKLDMERRPCYNEAKFSQPLQPEEGLPYPIARAVMNRHLYGDSHGPSTSALSSARGYSLPHGVSFNLKSQARIIENELFLLTTAQIWHSRKDGKEMRLVMDDTKLKICAHLSLGKDPSGSTHRIPELDVHPANISGFDKCTNARGSCPVCQTDYTVNVDQDKKKGWLVQLRIYQQLGQCRSPKDWAWTHWETEDEFGLQRSDYTSPGMVRSLWSKGDEEEVAPEGEFVHCPPKQGLLDEPVYSRGSACTICRGHAHCQRLRPGTDSSRSTRSTGTTLTSLYI